MFFIAKVIRSLQRRIWQLYNRNRFKNLGSSSYIKNPIFITQECTSIGNNVFVNSNARIEGVFEYENVKFKPQIIIENNCTIQQNLHLTCAHEIFIGKNTAIAANVTISDIIHPYKNINLPIERQQLIVKPVRIGDDCKIYNNAVILPDISIGNHTVIGANSVVTKNIPAYSVAVGSPARVIKRYCFEDKLWKKTNKDGSFLN